ncbi:Protein of unknown function [Gryllus bimaculatus]|nr:Protein of unknown function [Gryllus bimaculatus]
MVEPTMFHLFSDQGSDSCFCLDNVYCSFYKSVHIAVMRQGGAEQEWMEWVELTEQEGRKEQTQANTSRNGQSRISEKRYRSR